jgi:hypothetical protein
VCIINKVAWNIINYRYVGDVSTMQVKGEITNFFNIGESFSQAWGRFFRILMRVPTTVLWTT